MFIVFQTFSTPNKILSERGKIILIWELFYSWLGWNEQGVVNDTMEWVESQERIDMAALQARDPILFYDEVIMVIVCPNYRQQG